MDKSLHPTLMGALELQASLERLGLPFCFIGGLAIQRWGQPRFTADADATVLTRFVDDEKLVDHLLAEFPPRRADGRDFALRNRVLLLNSSDGVGLDIALGAFDFEERSIARSSLWKYAEDIVLRTCCAEDLVVHKAFASRDLDWGDLDTILMSQGRKLDVHQILAELRPLAELKDDTTIVPRLEGLMRKRDVID